MESERFDRMVASLGAATDRRAAVRGLAAVIAGLGVARTVMPEVAAAADDVETERCGGKRAKCSTNRDCCDGLKCKDADPYMQDSGLCKFKSGHGNKGDWCKKNSDCNKDLTCRSKKCR